MGRRGRGIRRVGMCRVDRIDDNEEFRNTLWSDTHAARRDVGADFMAPVWERLQPGYASALKKWLRVGQLRPELRPRRLLEETMLGILRCGAFESRANRLLSAIQLVEKTGTIKPLVHKADWLFVKAVSKFKSKSEREPVKWLQLQCSGTYLDGCGRH